MRRTALCALCALAAFVVAPSAFGSNYVVLYNQQSVPADSSTTIQKAGGSIVATYPQIGVVIASSSSPSFRESLLKDARIQNASSTERFAYRLPAAEAAGSGGAE